MNRQASGRSWEAVARDYLKARGLRILRQRYLCRLGELDLVCLDGTTIVVVEVRARKKGSLTSAIDSIDWAKRRKIIRATRHLLMCNPQWNTQRLRFDVFAVSDIDTTTPQFQWTQNAFDTD
jgi:putative endonuclease